MNRRALITLLGGAALPSIVWRLTALAQQTAMPLVGFLNSRARGEDLRLLDAFHRGLKEADYVEGNNVAIEYRFAEGQNDRLPAMAADLVRGQVAVIAANGPAVVAAKAATMTIPIVFSVGLDPVELGLVASLSQPGGNLTGVTALFDEVGPKRLELLHEWSPGRPSLPCSSTRPIPVPTNSRQICRRPVKSADQQAAALLHRGESGWCASVRVW